MEGKRGKLLQTEYDINSASSDTIKICKDTNPTVEVKLQMTKREEIKTESDFFLYQELVEK